MLRRGFFMVTNVILYSVVDATEAKRAYKRKYTRQVILPPFLNKVWQRTATRKVTVQWTKKLRQCIFSRWFTCSFSLRHISFSAHLGNFRWIKSKLALDIILWFNRPLFLRKSNVWNMSNCFKVSCCCCGGGVGISVCLCFVPSLAYTGKGSFLQTTVDNRDNMVNCGRYRKKTNKQTNKEYHAKCSSSISSCNQKR